MHLARVKRAWQVKGMKKMHTVVVIMFVYVPYVSQEHLMSRFYEHSRSLNDLPIHADFPATAFELYVPHRCPNAEVTAHRNVCLLGVGD